MHNLFLDTLTRKAAPGSLPPVWMMRQAGRYLPEYRALREKHSFLAMVQNPEAALEATLQPIRRYGMDAAIIFSDIMVPLMGVGIEIDFVPGPKLAQPFRNSTDLARLRPLNPEKDTGYLLAALRATRAALVPEKTALIGFAGAPLTLAAYLIEGGGSKEFELTRAALKGDPAFARGLLDRLAAITTDYLLAQVEAGAQAVQLFDSWAGILDLETYEALVLPGLQQIITTVGKKAPVIYFAQNGAHLYSAIKTLPADGLSVDWRLPLSAVAAATGNRFVMQGNLDPALLLTTPEQIRAAALAIRRDSAGGPGLILNLGHGISRHTPLENAGAFIDAARLPL